MEKITCFFSPECKHPRVDSDPSPISDNSTEDMTTDSSFSSSESISRFSCVVRAKHKYGYNSAWEREWPWLQFVEGQGMFATLCSKYKPDSHNKSRTWIILVLPYARIR